MEAGSSFELRYCSSCSRACGLETSCPGCGGALTVADHTLLLGQRFGKYTIESLIGHGGMGAVLAARHATLERTAAIKVVLPQAATSDLQRRFEREARVLAELKHPNIVEIYDFDWSDLGLPYYVMELLPGVTLRQHLATVGLLDRAACAAVTRGVAEGLTYAHRRRIVHRDLKPANIFLARYERQTVIKILDFGLAKLAAVDHAETHLTATGTVVGTLLYLAPEQIFDRPIGPATDQYALGLVIAELLTGKPVRHTMKAAEIFASAGDDRDMERRLEATGLADDTVAALVRATRVDPGTRFPDLDALVAALGFSDARADDLHVSATAAAPAESSFEMTDADGLTVDLPSSGRRSAPPCPSPPAEAPAPPAPRSRRWAIVALVAVAAALAVAGLLWLRPPPVDDPGAPAETGQPVDGDRAPAPGLSVVSRHKVPPDTQRLLADLGDTLVLEGVDAVYLLPTDEGSVPARIAIDQGDRILGRDTDGGLIVLEDGQIGFKSYVSGRLSPWLEGPAAADHLLLATGGRYLVAGRGAGIEISATRSGALETTASIARSIHDVRRWAVGSEHLILVGGGTAELYTLGDGRPVGSVAAPEDGIFELEVADGHRLVAAGGSLDDILLFDFSTEPARTRTIPGAGPSDALLLLGDGSTLLAAGADGLVAWSVDDPPQRLFHLPELHLRSLDWTQGSIVARTARGAEVVVLEPPSPDVITADVEGDAEIWALAGDSHSSLATGGGSDGGVVVWETAAADPRVLPLHERAVTSVVLTDDRLAAGSHDGTISVWKRPELTLQWRSRSHDYIINGLFLTHDGASLWSAGSDGALKRWSFPDLSEQESIDPGELLGGFVRLSSVWCADGGSPILVGTWANALIVLEPDPGGGWEATAHAIEPRAVRSLTPIPSAGIVVFTAFHRLSGLFAYDLVESRLLRLDDNGLVLTGVTRGWAEDEILVVGEGALLRYRLHRGEDGQVTASASVLLAPALGGWDLTRVGAPPGLVIARGDHRLSRIDRDALVWPPERPMSVRPLD